MDYGKRAPDLGWRMTDAWLSMAGSTSPGLPNGRPIDEWGIRMEEGSCNPAGASVSRGGGTNGPASVYAIAKWDEWLRKYAPPGAADLDFYQSLPALAHGNVAQQIFWYTAFTADMVTPKDEGNNTVDDAGTPLWRMAPSPHGPYWKEGMKLGYQDVGSWTLLKSTPVDRRKAAWLYAQFVVSKTVDVKKSHVGLTVIRDSHDQPRVVHRARAEARRLGRVLPLARPRALDADRRQRAGLSEARADLVAADRRRELRRLHAAGSHGPARRARWTSPWPACRRPTRPGKVYGGCGPRLNEEKDPSEWLGKENGPAAKLENEKPQGETIAYDELVKRWAAQ